MTDEPMVLGIETSCDETGVGIVRGHTLLADAVASSVAEHARFGGVVPEVASRAHLEAMVPTMHRALAEAGVTLADVDAVAVTAGPGLAGALLVGVAAAKAYALAAGKPIYGVNHLAAHVAVDTLEHGPLPGGTEDQFRQVEDCQPAPGAGPVDGVEQLDEAGDVLRLAEQLVVRVGVGRGRRRLEPLHRAPELGHEGGEELRVGVGAAEGAARPGRRRRFGV